MVVRKLEIGVLATAFVVLVLDAHGGSGWAATSTRTVVAARLDHTAGAPLYDLLAGVAALLPVGEPAFRLGLLGALLGALTLAGVVAALRALVPKEPAAGVIGAILVGLAPPFRDLLATPNALAACGTVWALAFVLAAPREPGPRTGATTPDHAAGAALAAAALVIGSAPWLGVTLALALALHLRRHARIVVPAVGAIGVAIVLWWFDAPGALPGFHLDLAAAVAASGRGAGAIVIGAGLLGLGIAAATALPRVRILAGFAALVAAHEILVGGAPGALLAIFGVAVAIVPAALVKLVAGELAGGKRDAAVLACGIPLVLAALGTGAALVTDDGTTPRRLVADLIDELPPGPGTFIATRTPSFFALQYERAIAGARPDLDLAPPLPPQRADVVAADALRAGRLVASDAAAFGRLDIQRTRPRGRGFQLLGAVPSVPAAPVAPPADYATAIGADESLVLAIERAQLEAATGHLDRAARAAGLVEHAGSPAGEAGARTSTPYGARFGAADLALLAATQPTRARPSLFGFLPLTAIPRGPWLADVFGDDLAWMAAIQQPTPPLTAPMPRRLHALWREIFEGTLKPDAPEIAALGPAAVAATTAMWTELAPTK
ncbi:MAG: hypothetical protein ABI467_26905 [Kofleriaceae bacterium]